jgi:RND superfamily putative drug exporter
MPMMPNFTGRVLDHRRTVVVSWCGLLLVAALLGARVQNVIKGGSDGVPGSPSVVTIERAVKAGIPAGTFFPFLIVVRNEHRSVHDSTFREGLDRLAAALERVPGGGAAQSFWTTGRADLLGRDRHTALVVFRPNVERLNDAEMLTRGVRAAVQAAEMPPGFETWVTGTPPMYFDLDRQSASDLLTAERIGIPITLLILLLAFRAPLAACLPLLLAAAAVTVGTAALFVLGHMTTVSIFSLNVVSMIGLGLGVDYSLFVVSSVRRRLEHGHDPDDAIERAVTESSHAIIVSGIAIALAFCSLLLVNIPFLRSLALAGIVITATAVAAALTLLPAALSFAGRALNWPLTGRSGRADGARFWTRWTVFVVGHPRASLLVGLGVLAIFIVPVSWAKSWNIGVRDLAARLEAREGYDRLAESFEQGWIGPAVLTLETPRVNGMWDTEIQHAVTSLANRLAEDTRIARVTGFPDVVSTSQSVQLAVRSHDALPERLRDLSRDVVSPDGRLAIVVVVPTGAVEGPDSMALVDEWRRDPWPELDGLDVSVSISGTAALTKDFDDEVFGQLPIVAGVLLGSTFLLLLVAFRSVLVPLKAIVLTLLSVLASYGFLVYVFQDGLGAPLIALEPPGGLNAFVVLVLFTMLFGLSMDYEVFLLSRVRAEYARTGDDQRALAVGVGQTAGAISSAAAIMVSIFLGFGFTRLVATRQFGLGLAFAVALDATIVRLVMVPALMALFGAGNWWMPAWLDRACRSAQRFRYTPALSPLHDARRPETLQDHAVEPRARGWRRRVGAWRYWSRRGAGHTL